MPTSMPTRVVAVSCDTHSECQATCGRCYCCMSKHAAAMELCLGTSLPGAFSGTRVHHHSTVWSVQRPTCDPSLAATSAALPLTAKC